MLAVATPPLLCPSLRYDSLTGVPSCQRTLAFEKGSVLFNIGALYTQMGARQDRSAAAGIDRAIDAFQRAAGRRNRPIGCPAGSLCSSGSALAVSCVSRECRCVQLPEGELLQRSQPGHEQSVPVYVGAADDRPGAGVCV